MFILLASVKLSFSWVLVFEATQMSSHTSAFAQTIPLKNIGKSSPEKHYSKYKGSIGSLAFGVQYAFHAYSHLKEIFALSFS